MLGRIRFERFTAFDALDISFSPGMNVFIGENGTGKTHILKAAYAASDIAKTKGGFAEKINNVFYPSGKQIGRLVKRSGKSTCGFVEVTRKINWKPASLRLTLSNHCKNPSQAKVSGSTKAWGEHPFEAVYIPVKDMTANAPGFRSLYEEREIHFEEIYVDILRKAFLPLLKGRADRQRQELLDALQHVMDGKVITRNEEFYLRSREGELEFTLLAEGFRKLGLIWLLIQNGTLLSGSSLFWDEPETNLNPKLMKTVIGILIGLQRMGVQIFVSTHDYAVLKEFDLQTRAEDKVVFHSLFRDANTGQIGIASTTAYLDISPNAIDTTFGDMLARDIQKSMEGNHP